MNNRYIKFEGRERRRGRRKKEEEGGSIQLHNKHELPLSYSLSDSPSTFGWIFFSFFLAKVLIFFPFFCFLSGDDCRFAGLM